MSNQRNREEVVNTQLALLISKLGVTADAETIRVHGKHRPDVIFQLRGLRVIIEGKFADTQNAEQIVLEDARKRVRAGIAHIVAATIYSDELRSAPTTKLLDALIDTQLHYCIITETFEGNWFEGNPASLMEALRRAQESLTEDDIVEKTAKDLYTHLENIANLWAGQSGACDRLSKILSIGIPKDEDAKTADERREMASKVSALVLANSFIFQEQLAFSDERVDTLGKLGKNANLVTAISEHWRWIWENINYVPIFQLGERILDELPASANTTRSVKLLLVEAQNICTKQAALRHDLMGRIYHWLLHYAKYLGTYYTSVSAATLLLKVTLDLEWSVDFGNARELADFKVADLACGTGTLLMAAAQAITDNFINKRAQDDKSIEIKDLSVLHSTLMQNIIHGYDILPSAVHLTASTLALLAPEVAFRQMNLFVVPIGMDHKTPRLGSLDFLEDDQIRTQFSLDNTHLDSVQTSAAKTAYTNAKVPKLDLCVMNPPFVSSRYGNLLFGSMPEERSLLQKELSKRAKRIGIKATAGLGALFVPLADRHIKKGGRIAFVLPIALATGEAWASVRKYLADRYHLELVITSHDPSRTNFSENTDLSEILFVARRLAAKENATNTIYVALRRNPRSIHEALDIASRISNVVSEIKSKSVAVAVIRSSAGVLGEVTNLPSPVGEENWTSALFAQSTLMKAHWHLEKELKLVVPGSVISNYLPLCCLGQLGTIGYDVRDITDAFAVDETQTEWSPYPAFWKHDGKKVVMISQAPNAFLIARTEALDGRSLKNADAVWKKAGTILLVSRLRTNTHRLISVGFDKAVLGNTWWAFNDNSLTSMQKKALLLWFNCCLGILMYFGRRAITQGAWMQMKKPAWETMPVLDVRVLTIKQLESLSNAYDALCKEPLEPIAMLTSDSVRIKIDEAICSALNIPSLAPLRELLAREPGLTGKKVVTDIRSIIDEEQENIKD